MLSSKLKTKKLLIISAIGLIILLIFIFGLVLPNNPNQQHNNIETIQDNEDIKFDHYINKYLNNNIVISEFPIGNPMRYTYNLFEYKVNDIPIEIALVNPVIFTSSDDFMKVLYMNSLNTGNYIESYDYVDEDISIRMAMTVPAIGGKSYLLIGAIIQEGRGYYFQIYIGDAGTYNITEHSINAIINFNHSRNPNGILELLKRIVKEKIPNRFFQDFFHQSGSEFEYLPRSNYDLPPLEDRTLPISNPSPVSSPFPISNPI